MKIKAAVFDIDGTLVPYGAPGPGQAAVQALRELAEKILSRKKGHFLCRNLRSVKQKHAAGWFWADTVHFSASSM